MKKSVLVVSLKLFTVSLLVSLIALMSETDCCSESVRGVTDTTIKIGLICDQTGPIAGDIGLPMTEALKIYTTYINKSGGIFGRKVKLFVEDDRYSIPAGIAAFKKLVFKDKIFALVGPVSVGGNKALFGQIDKHKVPNLSVAPDESMVRPLRKYTFMPYNLYDDQLGVIFDYILNDLKPGKVKMTFVYFDAESGKVALAATRKLSKLYNIDLHTEVINMGALDASSQVMNIKRKKSTHILIHHGSPGMVVLLKDLKKFGFNVPVFGTTIACTEDTVKMARSASLNAFGAHPFASWYDKGDGPARMRKITLKYRPGTEDHSRSKMFAGSWIGALTLYEGIKRAGKDLNIGGLLTGLESIKNLDTEGLCGPISFSPTNHQGLYHSKLYKADPENGKLVPITEWRKPPER